MNHTKASCGCSVAAVGSPNSIARRMQESRPCSKSRCRSRLPDKFTDEECEAWCWLWDCKITGWLLDWQDKSVRVVGYDWDFPGIVAFAKAKGWKQ